MASPAHGLPLRHSAREAASRHLAVLAARFPDLIPGTLQTTGLDDRDAALAHAIADAAVRRWLTLAHLLNATLKQPFARLQPELQGLLLAGSAQLLLLDRIPDHAAINESVELSKMLVRRGAAGLVNAVLRKIAAMRGEPVSGDAADALRNHRDLLPLPDGRLLKLTASLLPEDPIARIAAATSHSAELVRAWDSRLGRAATIELCLHNLTSPPTILNTRHARTPLPAGLLPHEVPGHHVFAGPRHELVSLLESRRDLWVQDPASSRAIEAAAASGLAPALVLDLCAGQGTKTRQLAGAFPDAKIIATDVDPGRFQTLRNTFAGSAQVEALPPAAVHERFVGKADLVLLDVPCSNTGVLARRPEAKYRHGPDQMGRLTGIQRQIIADAIPFLASSPRGAILYSTCSIEPDENQAQAQWASGWHRFSAHLQAELLPEGLPGGHPASYRDGSFHTILA